MTNEILLTICIITAPFLICSLIIVLKILKDDRKWKRDFEVNKPLDKDFGGFSWKLAVLKRSDDKSCLIKQSEDTELETANVF